MSHVIYVLETRMAYPKNYPAGILHAIWLMLTFSTIKKPYAKFFALISGIFLLFVLLLIIADLSSSLASVNEYGSISTVDLNDMKLCGNFYEKFMDIDKHEIDECLKKLEDGEYDGVVAGRLELGYLMNAGDK